MPLYHLFVLDTCYATSGHWRVGYGYLAGQFDNFFLLLLCGKCGRSKVLVQKAFSFVIFSSSFICLGFTVTFTWCINTNHGVGFFFPCKKWENVKQIFMFYDALVYNIMYSLIYVISCLHAPVLQRLKDFPFVSNFDRISFLIFISYCPMSWSFFHY